MSKDWYVRKLGGGQAPPSVLFQPQVPQPSAPMRGVQPPQAPPAGEGSMTDAFQNGDARLGGPKTRALMAKGNCPSCGSVNYLDDPHTNTSAHCFECNYSPRLGNVLSAE